MKKLSIIGCGKVGSTLATLWLRHGYFCIGDILDLSPERASHARDVLQAGRPVAEYNELAPSDLFLITTPDRLIGEACDQLAAAGILDSDSIVFHCSGAAPCTVLSSAQRRGASVASIHPVMSFADSLQSAANFAGTCCGIEGDKMALHILRPAIEAIGGRPLEIDPAQKAVYHAAAVFACNYLTTLLDIGSQALEKAGLTRTAALAVLEPIVRGTVDNIFNLGTVQALSGPIARGDADTVRLHLDALSTWDQRIAEVYRHLGTFTLELARQQENAPVGQHDLLSQYLEEHKG